WALSALAFAFWDDFSNTPTSNVSKHLHNLLHELPNILNWSYQVGNARNIAPPACNLHQENCSKCDHGVYIKRYANEANSDLLHGQNCRQYMLGTLNGKPCHSNALRTEVGDDVNRGHPRSCRSCDTTKSQ